ncbi:MAG: biotin transporter BioY [Planctomycetes bacterium]|nr:biotin transporter BioY [Planctomycetota bacterium]
MIAGLTVADLARPAERRLSRFYDAALIVGGSIAIALSAQVAILHPVPITGQTFAVLMVAALLGSRRGVLCILAYLAEGLLGLPVFAQGKAGLAAFLGPTGGYLVGFTVAAWIVGALSERTWDRRVLSMAGAMVVGNLAIYACGLVWLFCLVHVFAKSLGGGVLAVGLYPFLAGDVLKIVLAATLLPSGWKILRHFRLDGAPNIR